MEIKNLVLILLFAGFAYYLYRRYYSGSETEGSGGSSKRGDVYFYYRNGCPPCEEFKPTWAKIAATLSEKGWNIHNIHTPDHQELKHDIKGTPTIVFEKGSDTVFYIGDRTYDDVCQFADTL